MGLQGGGGRRVELLRVWRRRGRGRRRSRSEEVEDDEERNRRSSEKRRKNRIISTSISRSHSLRSSAFSVPGGPLASLSSRQQRFLLNSAQQRMLSLSLSLSSSSSSVCHFLARPCRLVESDVEEEEGGPSREPRGRGAHGPREHRMRAPGVELLVVDHSSLMRAKKEEKEFGVFFLLLPSS